MILPKFSFSDQSFVEPGPERVHYARLGLQTDADNNQEGGKVVPYTHEDGRTLYQSLRRGLRLSNDGPCLGWRAPGAATYQWLKYSTVIQRAANFGKGLRHLGLKEKEFVGIFSGNNKEWVICEQGLYCYSMVIVPLYDTLGPQACQFIIEQAELTTVICEDNEKVNSLLDDSTPACLKRLICIKEIDPETVAKAGNQGIRIYSFQDVEKMGEIEKDNPDYPERVPEPDDISTLSYTSGTTGTPKAVILTHANFIASVTSILIQIQSLNPCPQDVQISFLPLAHAYERVNQGCMIYCGGSIGFFSGDVLKLMDDIKALRPTFFPCVPRLLNKVFDKVVSTASESLIKKTMLRMALKSKRGEVERGYLRKNSIWDLIVFRKLQEAMGGRVRFLFSGAAPINSEVLNFFRCALGCHVMEAYGQTETAGPAFCTVPGDIAPDSVGPPLPCLCIKLVDVPEMSYYADRNKGELYIKGANIFKGYYKNPEETAAAFDEDGWLKTGDIGQILANGTVRIIDRRKHIFKLSQGEYIAPERIESIYSQSPYVSQIFVYGESLKSCLVAVIVPDMIAVKALPDQASGKGTDAQSLCENPNVKKIILQDILKLGKAKGLKSFEQVKDIYLHPELFSLENGLLTPTLKSKRFELKKYFKTQLEEMYSTLN